MTKKLEDEKTLKDDFKLDAAKKEKVEVNELKKLISLEKLIMIKICTAIFGLINILFCIISCGQVVYGWRLISSIVI